MKQRCFHLGGFILCTLLPFAGLGLAEQPGATLPRTEPLDWGEVDLSGRLMDGAHRFVERKIAESVAKRGAFWARDFASAESYIQSVQPNR